jgi:hypothetical protein
MKRIFVTGTPGALTAPVAHRLYKKGWEITWPNQDLLVYNGKLLKERFYKNVELENIVHNICPYILSDKLPDYYDIPYPGPKEYISKFPGKVVLNSVLFAPFLNMWVNYVDAVIDIQATKDEDIKVLNDWTNKEYAPDYLDLIRTCHLSRYNEHVKLFDKVFVLTNQEVRMGYFDCFDGFISCTS